MSDNVKEIIDTLVRTTANANYYGAQIDALRNTVDAADVEEARKAFTEPFTGTISCDEIRRIFGWRLSDRARNAYIEHEAEMKRLREKYSEKDNA